MKSIAFAFLISLFGAHEYYSTITNINYNRDAKCFFIDIEFDTKDLEYTLNKHFDTTFNLGEENELEMSDDLLLDYIQENLFIKIKNQELEIELLNIEVDWSHTYIYLKSNFSKRKINQMKVTNSLLTEFFNSQSNIVQVRLKDYAFSDLLTNEKTSFEKKW